MDQKHNFGLSFFQLLWSDRYNFLNSSCLKLKPTAHPQKMYSSICFLLLVHPFEYLIILFYTYFPLSLPAWVSCSFSSSNPFYLTYVFLMSWHSFMRKSVGHYYCLLANTKNNFKTDFTWWYLSTLVFVSFAFIFISQYSGG